MNKNKHSVDYKAFRKATYNNDLITIENILKNNKFSISYINECMNIAAKKGYLDLMRYFIEQCNANIYNKDGLCLELAVKENHIDIVYYLFNRGKYIINSCNNALPFACAKGYVEIVQKFIENDRNCINKALNHACQEGQIDLIKYLIKESRDSNSLIHYNNDFALFTAIFYNQFETVKFLVEECGANIHNANIHAENNSLIFSSGYDNLDIIKYLIKHNVDVNNIHSKNKILLNAVFRHNLDIIKYIVSETDADIHYNNEALLIKACVYNEFEIIKYLVEGVCPKIGADIHVDDDKPFRLTVDHMRYNLDMLKYFCEKGANIHANNDEVLKSAEKYGYIDIIEYLKSLNK